jgi:hypothetical protein
MKSCAAARRQMQARRGLDHQITATTDPAPARNKKARGALNAAGFIARSGHRSRTPSGNLEEIRRD